MVLSDNVLVIFHKETKLKMYVLSHLEKIIISALSAF